MKFNSSECPVDGNSGFGDFEEFKPSVVGLAYAILIFSCVYYPVTIAWWLRWRNDEWLSKRSTLFMLLSAFGTLSTIVWMTLQTIVGPKSFLCDLFLSRFAGFPLVLGPIVVRLLLFHNKARFGQVLQAQAEAGVAVTELQNLSLLGSVRVFLYTLCGATRGLQTVTHRVTGRGTGFGTGTSRSGGGSVRSADSFAATSKGNLEARRVSQSSSQASESDAVAIAAASRLVEADLLFAFFVTTPLYGVLIFALLAVWSLAYIAIKAATPGNNYGGFRCVGCPPERVDGFFFTATLLAITLVGLVFLFRVRKSEDPLRIKSELRACLYISILVSVLGVFAGVDPGNLVEDGSFNWTNLVGIALIAVHTVQCPWQLWQSKRQKEMLRRDVYGKGRPSLGMANDGEDEDFEQRKLASNRDGDTLEAILNSESGVVALRDYLITEFSSESYYFYEAVKKFEDKFHVHSASHSRVLALNIMRTFLVPGSILQVNVSYQARVALEKAADTWRAFPDSEPDQDVFAAAKKEVLDLLRRDSFQRFLASAICRRWRRRSSNQNGSERNLVPSSA